MMNDRPPALRRQKPWCLGALLCLSCLVLGTGQASALPPVQIDSSPGVLLVQAVKPGEQSGSEQQAQQKQQAPFAKFNDLLEDTQSELDELRRRQRRPQRTFAGLGLQREDGDQPVYEPPDLAPGPEALALRDELRQFEDFTSPVTYPTGGFADPEEGKSSLVIGAAWSIWHAPLFLVEGTWQHGLGFGTADFWIFSFAILGLSVMLTWLVVGSGGSILLAMVAHILINMTGEGLPDDTTVRAIEMVLILIVAAGLFYLLRRMEQRSGAPLQPETASGLTP
jgi:hypothetical protein